MALLTLAVVFCVYALTVYGEIEEDDGEYRVAAPSLTRICNGVKWKPLFCLICYGFNTSCFSDGNTLTTLVALPTIPTTDSTTTTTTTTTAAPEA